VFDRILSLETTLAEKSVFLFGPRQTGKSTYLRQRFPDALFIDLLDTRLQLALVREPSRLHEMVEAERRLRGTTQLLVVIDEIQKAPLLLDEVHRHIESHPGDRFVLTGSSARKLRRGGVNLLAGRARRFRFSGIVHPERSSMNIPLEEALQWGGLPRVLLAQDKRGELRDYVDLYLREEIQAEGITRSLATFSRFLELAATTNTKQVAYRSLSNETGVSSQTISDYYQVLEDTLVGERLAPFRKGAKRKPVATPKFFFFDIGVTHHLLGRFEIQPHTSEFGETLEHFVYTELNAYLAYRGDDMKLYFWRSQSNQEVDFVIELPDKRIYALEVKATASVARKHLQGLVRMGEDPDFRFAGKFLVALEPMARLIDDILILPLADFTQRLWSHRLLKVD
jgi:predicted AAA+ superfamily ATPase